MNSNPYSLSNQEVEVLRSFAGHPAIAFVSGTDYVTQRNILKSFLYGKLGEGKTVILRTSRVAEIIQVLKAWGLANLSLELKEDTTLSNNILEKNIVTDRDYQIEAIKTNTRYKQTLASIHSIQSRYNKHVFGDYSRRKLCELLHLSKKRDEEYRLELDLSHKHYDFNHEEFWQLRKNVEKSSKHYRSSYAFLKAGDEFKNDIYYNFHISSNQSLIFSKLNSYLKKCEVLISSYRSVFEKISRTLYATYRSSVDRLSSLTDDLELELSYYRIELELAPKTRVFSRAKSPMDEQKKALRSHYQMILDLIVESQIFKIVPPENSWEPQLEELDAFNKVLREHISNAHLIIQNKVEEQLEILNANNYKAEELVNIGEEQHQLINTINSSSIFKKEIHNLSVSAWKNYEFLKTLREKISKSKIFLEANMNYAVYRSFESSLHEKVKDVLSALYKVKPSSWVESYENWYFKALFDKYYIHELASLESKCDQLEELKHKNKEFENFRISHVFSQKRYSQRKLEKRLVKETLNWKSALILDRAGFKGHFPIIVCDDQFFPSELVNMGYDYLVCDENEQIPTTLFANSKFAGILSMSKHDPNQELLVKAKGAKNYPSQQKFRLKSKGISNDLRMGADLKSKLALGKYLTYILKEAGFEKKFYSARDFSVITCMSDFCTKLLEIELYDQRIKPLKYTHIESGIVDDIIIKDDSSKYLIIQDGFLDPALDMEWQVSAIRLLRVAGIKVVSLDAFTLALDQNGSILDLLSISELKEVTIPKSPSYES